MYCQNIFRKNQLSVVTIFKEIKTSKNTYVASFSLYTLVEIYQAKKDVKEAKAFRDELNKNYSDSIYAFKAKSIKL